MLTGDGVDQFQRMRTQQLVLQAKLSGKRLGSFTAILGIAQNGIAHIGAMDTELMGAAGDGMQFQFT